MIGWIDRLFFRGWVSTLPAREETTLSQYSGPWRVAGAAVTGTTHMRMGIPCQDALEYKVLPNGVLIIAVADGAGTASRSQLGARLAVSRAISTLESRVKRNSPGTCDAWEFVIWRAFFRTYGALLRLAASQRNPIRDYATTLTCVAASLRILAVGQIGDGAVIGKNLEGDLFSATKIQKGEYANETHFLTQTDALKKVEIRIFEQPIDAVAVTSDGLIRLAIQLQSGEPFAPFFDPLFAYTKSARILSEASVDLASFLSSERVCARSDDDKTLVIAVRSNGLNNNIDHSN